jgi:ParB family chromosome partitioning protein
LVVVETCECRITDQSFEIVAGARRYRAAQMAEAPTVPVRIVNLTDSEALEGAAIRFICSGQEISFCFR